MSRVSLGSKHDETGLLLQELGVLILRRDDGGRWRLDAVGGAERMFGQRVRVQGVRSGFDVLDVQRIRRVD
jgi:hypothetical protein